MSKKTHAYKTKRDKKRKLLRLQNRSDKIANDRDKKQRRLAIKETKRTLRLKLEKAKDSGKYEELSFNNNLDE